MKPFHQDIAIQLDGWLTLNLRMQRVTWWSYTADSLLGVRLDDPKRALDDIEEKVAKGAIQVLSGKTVRINGKGEYKVFEPKP